MRIIIFGPPGSGKGTQSHFITKKYRIPHVSLGNILRSEIEGNSKIASHVQYVVSKGNLVHDDLIIKILKERISQKDCKEGFILDGFPRTLTQATSINTMGFKIDLVLKINITDQTLKERISGRIVHPPSGRTYHNRFNPPKTYNRDDVTGEKLTTRTDDKKVNIIRKRLKKYYEVTEPVTEYYMNRSKNGKLSYKEIDGNETLDKIQKYLENIIGNMHLNQ